MAVTYTENLKLGLQKNKTDYVNWDVIQANWQKIDEAVGGSGIRAGDATIILNCANNTRVGKAETLEVE